MTTTTVDVRTVARVAVQTSPSGLPDSDGGWATQRYLRFAGASEGCGQVVGEATLVQDFGVVLPQQGGQVVSIGYAPDIARQGVTLPVNGQIVRLLKQDGGSVNIDGLGYTPFWWGRITSSELVPDRKADANAGGRMTWRAMGLASCFDQLSLSSGIVLDGTASTLIGIGQIPGFNHQAGGERSATTSTINGATVYTHDLSSATAGNLWTAQQALAHLVAVGTLVYSYDGSFLGASAISERKGWNVTVNDGGLLGWTLPPSDFNGMTLLQAINAIVTRKRGLTWKLSVSGSAITISVYTTIGTTISAGAYTIPASAYTASLVAAGARWISNVQIVEDRSALANIIELRGDYPWIGITLAYKPDNSGQLKGVGFGWSTADETSWKAWPASPFAEQVNRVFQVSPTWDGNSDDFEGNMETSSDRNGARAKLGPMPTARMLRGERALPVGVGLGSTIGGVLGVIGPREKPIIVVANGTAFTDKSNEWSVEITYNPLAVTINDGANGVNLSLAIGTTGTLYVSLGMREFLPLRVWWQDDAANWRTPTPTVKVVRVPHVQKWRVASGMVTGVDQLGSALTRYSADLVVRDDTNILRGLLPLAIALYGQPQTFASWTDRANHDIGDEFAPARLLTSVQLGDTSVGMSALITRRAWVVVDRDNVRMIDTQYVTERIVPDLEAML